MLHSHIVIIIIHKLHTHLMYIFFYCIQLQRQNKLLVSMTDKEPDAQVCKADNMGEPRAEPKGPKVYRLMGSVKTALFIISTGLLVFAAARNSFHW